jgi:putative ABC transport system ATP-binding protein
MGVSEARPASLSLEGLVKTRESGGHRFTLEVPRFLVRQGEFIGLTGASGSGKSTLLDQLALILRPSSARRFEIGAGDEAIDVLECWQRGRESILAAVRRSRMGYVLQTGGLLPFLNVEANAELALRLVGAKDRRRRIVEVAQALDIAQVLRKKPRQLSGGQRQRAAILRAIAHSPTLILADEPTASVDKPRAKEIIASLKRLAASGGTTVILVSHDEELLRSAAHRIFRFRVESRPGEARSQVVEES